MRVTCPSCHTAYRVDPSKLPAQGVRARCERCPASFRIEPEHSSSSLAAGPVRADTRGSTDFRATATASPVEPFGSADASSRAGRLARVLVSDIKAYHPDRWERSTREGTLKQEFREEIRKSWGEYSAQVGNEIATRTSYFRDALNEILAKGQKVF